MTDINQAPRNPNGVVTLEILSGNDEAQELTRYRKCRLLCSWEHNVVVILVLVVGGLNIFICDTYESFRFRFREGVWVFFALSILSCLLAISFMVRTCTAIQPKKKKEVENESKRDPTPTTAMFNIMKANYYHVFDVNGKYYLVKMYISEMFEHIQQVYCLTKIYVCMMPVEVATIVGAVLTLELLVNIWATFHINSQETRNRMILLDILTDMFCAAFPLLYSYIFFKIPVQVSELVLILVFPTLSLYLKLNDVWENYFMMDLQRIAHPKQHHNSTRSSRRGSILMLSHNRDILDMQLKHFPIWLRYAFLTLNIGFVLFFVSVISVHLATRPPKGMCGSIFTRDVWKGCKVEVPFCQQLFVAKCDCAVLEILNYTKRALPESFGNLSSLVKLAVYKGQLEQLPQEIGNNQKRLLVLMIIGSPLEFLPTSVANLQNLLHLRVSNTNLESLPGSIGNLRTLTFLVVTNNRFKSLPDSTGNLQNLLSFDVSHNRLEFLPDSIGKLQNLEKLWIFNNKLKFLPDSVGNLKHLQYLRVYNNRLVSLPDSVGKLQALEMFLAWNNKLTSLPNAVGYIKSIIWADVRNNNLTNLPYSLRQWNNVRFLYLAGNPLCLHLEIPSHVERASGLCDKQCSADCPVHSLGQYGCDDNDYTYRYSPFKVKPKSNSGCNTVACEYDKGECPR